MPRSDMKEREHDMRRFNFAQVRHYNPFAPADAARVTIRKKAVQKEAEQLAQIYVSLRYHPTKKHAAKLAASRLAPPSCTTISFAIATAHSPPVK
jgi:hypothetical protein